jgi:hypothetical protein
MLSWFHVSGPVVRQNITWEWCGGTVLFNLWQPGSQVERETKKKEPSKVTLSDLLQPGPSSKCF